MKSIDFLKTDLTDQKCKFHIRDDYNKNNDYEIDLCEHDGEQCTVGFFDGECYNVMFSDGSSYDAFPEELFKL